MPLTLTAMQPADDNCASHGSAPFLGAQAFAVFKVVVVTRSASAFQHRNTQAAIARLFVHRA